MATLPLTVSAEFLDPFEKLRAFFSLSKASETALRHSTVSALHHLFQSLQTTVASTVQCRDAAEFVKRRDKAIIPYGKLIHAISLIAESEIDDENFAQLASDSLDHLHEEFVSLDIAHFGSEAAEQASFCIFTLKRIARLLPALIESAPLQEKRKQDRELSIRFVGYMLSSHFHLDCLRIVLKRHIEVPQGVVSAILDGMGECSSAYATIRQGLELRSVSELPLDDQAIWDDEDQALLDESERTSPTLT